MWPICVKKLYACLSSNRLTNDAVQQTHHSLFLVLYVELTVPIFLAWPQCQILHNSHKKLIRMDPTHIMRWNKGLSYTTPHTANSSSPPPQTQHPQNGVPTNHHHHHNPYQPHPKFLLLSQYSVYHSASTHSLTDSPNSPHPSHPPPLPPPDHQ